MVRIDSLGRRNFSVINSSITTQKLFVPQRWGTNNVLIVIDEFITTVMCITWMKTIQQKIQQSQYGRCSWPGSEPSTLEIDVCVRRYALLVVLARNDDDDDVMWTMVLEMFRIKSAKGAAGLGWKRMSWAK